MKNKLIIPVTTILAWIGIGTVVFHSLEKWSWIEAFYFSVVTLTTVGYGDLTPTSDLARLFVSLYILFGVAIVLVALNMIGIIKLRRRAEKISKRKKR